MFFHNLNMEPSRFMLNDTTNALRYSNLCKSLL